MVFTKSIPSASASKANKITNKLGSVRNKNLNTKSVKKIKTTVHKKSSNKKIPPKKSKKINKLLSNNFDEEETFDSSISNYNNSKSNMLLLNSNNCSNTINSINTKKSFDAYDFDETNDSYENVEIFNKSKIILTSNPPSSSNFESDVMSDDNNNIQYDDNKDLDDENHGQKLNIHHYSRENLIAQSKIYQKKMSSLKAQLDLLKKLSKTDTKNLEPVQIQIPLVKNYVKDYMNECNTLDKESSDNLLIVEMWYEKQKLEIDRQRDSDILRISNDYSQKIKDLKTKLLNQQLEMKNQLDIERNILSLNIDPADIHHNVLVPVKRKLRRRNTSFNNNDKLSNNIININKMPLKSSNIAHNNTNNINNSSSNQISSLNQVAKSCIV